MNNQLRNRRKVYLCSISVDENTNRKIFLEPKEMKLNYLPLSSTGEIISAGNEFAKRLVVYTTKDIAKDIHNNDRFFIYKEPPTEYDKTCADADFEVDGEPLKHINEGVFYLQRMTGDDE